MRFTASVMAALLVSSGAAFPVLAAPLLAGPNVGDRITCAGNGYRCDVSTKTVASGLEFITRIGSTDIFAFDFSDGLLTVRNATGTDFQFQGAGTVSFTDTTSAFQSATLQTVSAYNNITQSDISLSSTGTLTLDLGNFRALGRNSFFTIQFGPAAAAVPEPATWGMLLLGLGAVGAALRRRRAGVIKPQVV